MEDSASKKRLNVYQCQSCLHIICTVDRDDGVTPFMIECRAPQPCGGMMESSFYRVFPGLKPTFEWYRPDDAERTTLAPGAKDHVEKGGLLIRPIMSDQFRAEVMKSVHRSIWGKSL